MATHGVSGRGTDLTYRMLRTFLRASVRVYFRKIAVSGHRNIPEQGPAVLVANHPNSIIDAFLLGTQLTVRRVNFIAKDSIPNAPVIGPLLRKCGVIGVARRMDYEGEIRQTRGRNLRAIDTCTPHLERGEIITIFGEGISTDSRKLGVIKKGAIRLGYNAEEKNGFRLGVSFIPVGINYSAKHRFRSDVLINVGMPFRLTEIAADPSENPPKVLLEGTRRLQASIEDAVVNLRHEELGHLVDTMAELHLRRRSGSAADEDRLALAFTAKRRIIECVEYFNQTEPKVVEQARSSIEGYTRLLRRIHLDDRAVVGNFTTGDLFTTLRHSFAGLAGSLLALYGWANNLLPRYLGKFARRFGRQWTFQAAPDGAVKKSFVVTRETLAAHYGGWLGALIGFPLQVFLVASVVTSIFSLPAGVIVAAVYFLTLVPAWRFSLAYSERARDLLSGLRLLLQAFTHRVVLLRVRRRRAAVVRVIDGLLSRYGSLRPKVHPG